jgi:serine/threonine protein kinase
LQRKVALKILPAEVAADRQRMQRFIQEAKTASSLNHPNILTIFEIGKAGGTYFMPRNLSTARICVSIYSARARRRAKQSLSSYKSPML